MLTGQIELTFVTGTEVLHTGDAMTFSGREPHTWRNPSDTDPAAALWIIAPATWTTRT